MWLDTLIGIIFWPLYLILFDDWIVGFNDYDSSDTSKTKIYQQQGSNSVYYPEDSHFGYYCGPKDVIYADVSVTEPVINSILTTGEKVVTHGDYVRQPIINNYPYQNRHTSYGSTNYSYKGLPDPQRARSVVGTSLINKKTIPFGSQVAEMAHGRLWNPLNNSVVYTDSSFTLAIGAKNKKIDKCGLQFFASTGVDVSFMNSITKACSSDDDEVFNYNKYRVRLKDHKSIGHIQFFQGAKRGIRYQNAMLPYGSIINIFIYRNKSYLTINHLPIVNVSPVEIQTFVPLRAGQTMQIVLPKSYAVDKLKSKSYPTIDFKGSAPSNIDGYICHYFYALSQLCIDSIPIFFNALDCPKKGIIVVPPVETVDGKRYAVLYNPLSHLEIYTSDIDGIIFRTKKPLNSHRALWLDHQTDLKLEKSMELKGLTGTVYETKVSIDSSINRLCIFDLLNDNGCTTKKS